MPPMKDKLPCTCGNRILEMWSGYGNFTIKCPKCGKEVYGKTKAEVVKNWNEMVRGNKDEG